MEHQPRPSSTTQLPFQQLLEHNHSAVIENPLRRIPEDHVNSYIESFHKENKLCHVVDLTTLVRGARLARDEEAFTAEGVAEGSLSEVETAALKKEKNTRIWTESREIKIILLTCCVGSIVQGWTGTALGIAISGAISLIVPGSWRFQISSSFIPAFALLLLVFVGSESPRWLIKKQRYDKAYIVLSRLRGNPLLAARDLVFIWTQLQVETILFMRTNKDIIELENPIPYLDPDVYRRQIGLLGYAKRISQLFTIPRARRATLASFLVMTAQQMTGVNVFAFLASTLFEHGEHKGNPDRGSQWLFFGFGIANFL
ncbi:MAG: hypothetical protein Q9166_006420 [cf. Caloplaca sp. 2 TL-2023]